MSVRLLAILFFLAPARSPFQIPVAFSPDGKLLVTGGHGLLILWDASTGKEVRRVREERGGLAPALFTPDGKGLIAYDGDGGLQYIPVDPAGVARRVAAPPANDQLNYHFSQAISSDGKMLATGGFDSKVKVWDAGTGKLLHLLEGHTRSICSLAFTPDGKTLASIAYEDGIRLWDVGTGKFSRFIAHSGDGVAISPDGKLLAAAGPKDGTKLWDMESTKEVRSLGIGTTCVAFSPDGMRLAAAGGRTVHLWETATGKELRKFEADGHISAIAFRPDGKVLASGARGRDEHGNNIDVFRAWDTTSGDILFTLRPR